MTWYTIELRDGQAAAALGAQIEGAWIALAKAGAHAGKKTDYSMAVFRRGESGARQVTMYITPTAAVIAKVFGAVKCEKPSPPGIDLFLGDARAWDIFFPGERLETVSDSVWHY